MSQTSQLYSLTPNVKTQITVTGQANRVRVVNDSSLYLRVYFGADAPLGANDPGWHDTISPGDKPLLWITGGTGQTWWAQSGNASSTPFTGVITFLPFFPVGALATGGGVIAGAALLYITAFSPDESADRGGQTEAFVQAAKQGRLQSVAGAMPNTASQGQDTTQATPDSTVLNGLAISAVTPASAPNLFAANAAGPSVINFYIYHYAATLRARTPGVASADFYLEAVITNNANVVKVANAVLPVMLHAVNYGSDRYIFAPARAVVSRVFIGQGLLASGDICQFRYRLGTATPQTLGVYDIKHAMKFTIDVVNQTPLFDITTFDAGITFPWNAAYNPQTY